MKKKKNNKLYKAVQSAGVQDQLPPKTSLVNTQQLKRGSAEVAPNETWLKVAGALNSLQPSTDHFL